MPSRLSSLLVRDGLVGVRRMEKAFQRQVIYGGSLDTILLELGMVPEERLCQYLALASGLPPASRAEIEQIDAAAVAVLPLDAAQAYRAIPLVFEGEAVRMAVCAPIDLAALEDLADQIDRPLRPLLVPEYRWHLVLARAYGASVPQRYAALAAQMEKDPASQPVGRARTIIIENEPERDTIVGALPLPSPGGAAGIDESVRARSNRVTEDVLPAVPRTTSRPGEPVASGPAGARVRSPSQSGDTAPMRSRSGSQPGQLVPPYQPEQSNQSDEITAVRPPRPSLGDRLTAISGGKESVIDPILDPVLDPAIDPAFDPALDPALAATPGSARAGAVLPEESATVRPAVHGDTPRSGRRRGVTLIGVSPVRALTDLGPQGDLFGEGDLSPASGIPTHVRGELGDSDDTPPRRHTDTGRRASTATDEPPPRRHGEAGRRDTELQFPSLTASAAAAPATLDEDTRITDVEDPTPLPPAPPAPPRTRTSPMPAMQPGGGDGASSQPHAAARTGDAGSQPVTRAATAPSQPVTRAPTAPPQPVTRAATTPSQPVTRAATAPPQPVTRAPTAPPFPATRAPTAPPATAPGGAHVDAALEALRSGPSFTATPPPLAKDVAAISLRDARELLAHAEHRDDVFIALLRAVRHVAQWAGLLTVQGGVAIGRLALAHPELDTEQISSVLIPLDAPSPIRTALTSKRLYVGPLGKGDPAVDSMFLRMGGIRPPSLVVLPLVLRERVVAMVVAHRADRDVTFGDVADLLPLAALATEAIGRLILRSKGDASKPSSRAQTFPPPDESLGIRARTAPIDEGSAQHRAPTARTERRPAAATPDPDDPDPEPADDDDDDDEDTNPGEGELPRGWHGHAAEGAASSGAASREAARTRGRISEAPWRARAASEPSPWTATGQSGPVPAPMRGERSERSEHGQPTDSGATSSEPTRSPGVQPARSRSITSPGTTPAAASTRPSSPGIQPPRSRSITSPGTTPAAAPTRPSSPGVQPTATATPARPSSLPAMPALRPDPPEVQPAATAATAPPGPPSAPPRRGPSQPPPAPSSATAPVVLTDDALFELIEDREGAEHGAALDEAIARAAELLPAIAERFPGTLDIDRYAVTGRPLRAAQYGGLLELVTRMGTVASELLIEKMSATSRDTRFYAAVCLIELRPRSAISALFDRLFDPDFGVRACAVEALQGYAGRELEAGMIRVRQALHSDDVGRVAAAASAVAELADREALIDLISALPRGERFAEPCRRAMMSLTKQDFGHSDRKWGKWWDDHHRRHRVEWLIDGLQHKEAELRAQAIADLRRLTGESFGYEPEAGKRDRDIAHRRWLTWWNEVGRLRFTSNDNERHRPTALLPPRRDDR